MRTWDSLSLLWVCLPWWNNSSDTELTHCTLACNTLTYSVIMAVNRCLPNILTSSLSFILTWRAVGDGKRSTCRNKVWMCCQCILEPVQFRFYVLRSSWTSFKTLTYQGCALGTAQVLYKCINVWKLRKNCEWLLELNTTPQFMPCLLWKKTHCKQINIYWEHLVRKSEILSWICSQILHLLELIIMEDI